MPGVEASTKEDYFAHGTFLGDGTEFKGVPCKLFLPLQVLDAPRMLLHPTREQFDLLARCMEVGFRAELKGFSGKTEVEMSASSVYLSGATTRHWGPELSQSDIEGTANDLRVIRFHASEPDSSGESWFTFWLSPNKLLNPAIRTSTSYSGRVLLKRYRQHTFRLSPDTRIKLDRNFRSRLENDELRQWSHLVAVSKLGFAARDIESVATHVLPGFDDFLLLASFAARTRTACIGWEAADGQSITTYYRRNIAVPSGYSLSALRFSGDGLISIRDFPKFIRRAFARFNSLSQKQPIRKAIYSAVPGRPRVLEDDFLSLFSALEELVFDHRRNAGLDRAVPDQEWRQIEKHLRAEIKKAPGAELTSKQRGYLYSKLPELNRIPPRSASSRYEIAFTSPSTTCGRFSQAMVSPPCIQSAIGSSMGSRSQKRHTRHSGSHQNTCAGL